MTMSLNSVGGFNSKMQAKLWSSSRPYPGASTHQIDYVKTSLPLDFGSRKSGKYERLSLVLAASDGNQVTAKTAANNKDYENAEKALTNDPPSINSLAVNQTNGSSNVSDVPSDATTKEVSSIKVQKKSPLTAREKLRAARVLSRYIESKPTKTKLGSKVLDALRESDRGKKRSGLPEAPSNMLDDSKRGMPKQGLTFDLPGGNELFFIIFSAVSIGTLMFATTFVVWKLGAIHFNEN